jgi:hypothetical protein
MGWKMHLEKRTTLNHNNKQTITHMRKLVLAAVLLASGTALFAQNLDAVQEKISQNKYAERKSASTKCWQTQKGRSR